MGNSKASPPTKDELAARLEALTGLCAQGAFVYLKAEGKNTLYKRSVTILSTGGTPENAEHIKETLGFYRDAVADKNDNAFTPDDMGFIVSTHSLKYEAGKEGFINKAGVGSLPIKILNNQIFVTGRAEDNAAVLAALEERNFGEIIQGEIQAELSTNKNQDLTKCHADAQQAAGTLKRSLAVEDVSHDAKTPSGAGAPGEQKTRS